jgi:hypothetical protein
MFLLTLYTVPSTLTQSVTRMQMSASSTRPCTSFFKSNLGVHLVPWFLRASFIVCCTQRKKSIDLRSVDLQELTQWNPFFQSHYQNNLPKKNKEKCLRNMQCTRKSTVQADFEVRNIIKKVIWNCVHNSGLPYPTFFNYNAPYECKRNKLHWPMGYSDNWINNSLFPTHRVLRNIISHCYNLFRHS